MNKIQKVKIIKKPRTSINPASSHIKSLRLRKEISSGETIFKLKKAWNNNKSINVSGAGVEVLSSPFKVCIVKHLVSELEHLHDVVGSLVEMVPMPPHETDLFKFCQSSALASAGKDTPVSVLVQFLERVLRGLVEEVTGLTLDGAVTSTMSLYGYTDYLLCHDDRQNNRKIAFIWYLTENWREEYGGHLDLFDSKGGYPTEIVRSILPEENSLVFFEVCDRSFHQVSEVLTRSKPRLSVNGWFHLPTAPARPSPTNGLRHSTALTLKTPSYALVESEMCLFVNNEYLQHDQQIQINRLIEENSEISLDNFLKAKWADKITTELCSSNVTWHLRGPPNRRKYEVADERSLGPTVTRFLNLMKSQHMFALLEKMTQLELTSKWAHKNGEQSLVTPKCGYQVQRWRRGFYTLASDEDFCETVPVLDVFINFNCAEWTQESGGFMSYIGRGDEDELLNVPPQQNNLAIVYRDPDTSRFVKYINSFCEEQESFYTLSFTYYECGTQQT